MAPLRSKRAGPATASLTAYVAPIVALLAGVIVRGELITLIQILGCALILAGAGMVVRAERAARAVQQPEFQHGRAATWRSSWCSPNRSVDA